MPAANIENTMAIYAKRWNLSRLKRIDYRGPNYLFTCESAGRGPCVLKIGEPHGEIENECGFLKHYSGSRFCEVIEADSNAGVLLLERILPGTRLREEPSLEKRLEVFSALFVDAGTCPRLHREAPGRAAFPSYLDWVSRIAAFMRGMDAYKTLSNHMSRAEEICAGLWEKYRRVALLHGDLHHDNILLGSDNSYRVIDPKGVTGDPVFDIPRFILNEFDDSIDTAFRQKFCYITAALSRSLGVPEDDIRRLVYVEMCMAHSWNVESREEPNMARVLFAVPRFAEEMLPENRRG